MTAPRTPRTRLRLVVGLKDLAAHFEVSTRTIQGWIARGEIIKPYRVGGRLLRWDVEVLNEWIEGGCKNVTEDEALDGDSSDVD